MKLTVKQWYRQWCQRHIDTIANFSKFEYDKKLEVKRKTNTTRDPWELPANKHNQPWLQYKVHREDFREKL